MRKKNVRDFEALPVFFDALLWTLGVFFPDSPLFSSELGERLRTERAKSFRCIFCGSELPHWLFSTLKYLFSHGVIFLSTKSGNCGLLSIARACWLRWLEAYLWPIFRT